MPEIKSKTSYRIYLDDDLLMERFIYWNVRTEMIKEIIVATLAKGKHSLRLQRISDVHGNCFFKNITINDAQLPIKFDFRKSACEFEI